MLRALILQRHHSAPTNPPLPPHPSTLKEYLGYSDKKMNSLAENIFHIFDDDENGLIDALEFLSSFSLISGMSVEEKVRLP